MFYQYQQLNRDALVSKGSAKSYLLQLSWVHLLFPWKSHRLKVSCVIGNTAMIKKLKILVGRLHLDLTHWKCPMASHTAFGPPWKREAVPVGGPQVLVPVCSLGLLSPGSPPNAHTHIQSVPSP